MKRFKDFIKSKVRIELHKDGVPILNTVFGSHSRVKVGIELHKDGTPILNTVFGKHSQKRSKVVKEDSGEHNKYGLIDDPDTTTDNDLKDHYNFPDGDHGIIHRYTIDSHPINNHSHALSTGAIKTGDRVALDSSIDKMDSALAKHRTPRDLVTYSGVKESPEHTIKKYGNRVKTSRFTSSSLDKRIAYAFAEDDISSQIKNNSGYRVRHMLKIHIPKGTPGAYVNHISEHRGEREFILPRNTNMHIHHEPEIDHENGLAIWHAHVLPNHENKE